MDVVIPYQQHFTNQDLRWAIASMRKHLHGIGNIFVVGDDPTMPDVIHVPFKDGPNIKGKELNIYNKIIAACNDPRVSDDFLFANDDHFLMDDYDIEQFPTYYSSTWPHEGSYADTTVKNTLATIPGSLRYYDVHCPIIYNKQKFIKAFENIKWPAYGYCIKTMYVYLAGAVTQHVCTPDCKIREWIEDETELRQRLSNTRWFSTGDKTYSPSLIKLMNEYFGN